MSSGEPGPVTPARTFGLRIALWYAALFVIGAILIVFLTYALTAQSLAQRDHEIIQQKLGEYALVYARGGIRPLVDTIQVEQRSLPERLYVRVVDGGAEVVVVGMPDGWDPSTLELVSQRMSDGTLVQVGKSSESRNELLARFRAALGLVTLSIVVLGLTGGS